MGTISTTIEYLSGPNNLNNLTDSPNHADSQDDAPMGKHTNGMPMAMPTATLGFTTWWLQPIWKIWSSNWIISPRIGVKIPKIFELPPPSYDLLRTSTSSIAKVR